MTTKLKDQEEVVEEMLNDEREQFEKDMSKATKDIAKWKGKFNELNSSSSQQAKQGSEATKALEMKLENTVKEMKMLEKSTKELESTIASKDSEIEASDQEIAKWKGKFNELNSSSSQQAKQGSEATKALEMKLENTVKEMKILEKSTKELESTIASKDSEIEASDQKLLNGKANLMN